MRLRTLVSAVCASAVVAGTLAGQDLQPNMAVLPFEDGGSYGRDQEDFAALERGIPGMLISELMLHPDARLVDRAEAQRLLDGQNLVETAHVNAATAAAVGRVAGVDYVVFGTYVDLYGKFRIDARIVDVKRAEIVQVAAANADRAGMFHVLQRIAVEILADVRLPPLPEDIEATRTSRTVPTDALTWYGRALLYQDRGDVSGALECYRRALEILPDYAEAREGLRRIEP